MDQNNSLRNETPRRKPFIKVLVSVLVAALVVGLFVGFNKPSNTYAAGTGEQVKYEMGDIASGSEHYKYVDGEIAYCLNQNLHQNSEDELGLFGRVNSPGLNYRLKYAWDTSWAGTTIQSFVFNQNNAGDKGVTKEQIAKILYLGYPHNATNFKSEYNRTDGQFYVATQDAIYRLIGGSTFVTAENKAVSDALVAAANDPNVKLPDNYNIYVYFADQKYQGEAFWQSVINLEFDAKISTAAGVDNYGSASSSSALNIELPENATTVRYPYDIVEYEGLTGGKEYVVRLTLYKSDGTLVKQGEWQRRVADASGKGKWSGEQSYLWVELGEGSYYFNTEIAENGTYKLVATHDGKNNVSEQINVLPSGTEKPAEPIDVYFDLTKELTGGKALEQNMFEFKLVSTATKDEVEITEGARWHSASDSEKKGALNRPLEAKIKKAGTYTFVIYENESYIKSGLTEADYEGVKYAEPKEFTVTVSENNGTLSVTGVTGDGVTNDGNNVNAGKFSNKYEETPAETTDEYEVEVEEVTFTNYVPDLKTTATDAESNDTTDKSIEGKTEAQIKDVVHYTNLVPGKTYTLEGSLHEKVGDGDSATEGETVEYSNVKIEDNDDEDMTFVASGSGEGDVTMIFTVDTTQYGGKSIVVYETLKDDNRDIVAHADIKDTAQTVKVDTKPIDVNLQLKKTITDLPAGVLDDLDGWFEFKITADENNPEGAKIIDASRYTNKDGNLRRPLKVEFSKEGTYDFTIEETGNAESGKNVSELTAKNIKLDADPINVTAEVTKAEDGSLVAKITVDGTEISSGNIVHADDANAQGYTVGEAANTYQKPGTTSITLTGAKELTGDGAPSDLKDMFQFGIYDAQGNLVENSGNKGFRKTTTDGTIFAGFKLDFENAGEYTYTIKENKEYRLEGADYTGISWTAEDQTYVITVVQDGTNLKVKSVTKATINGDTATANDKFTNTYSKPSIGTTASGAEENVVKADKEAVIKDVISYKNLKPNTTYTLEGELHTKNSDGTDAGDIEYTKAVVQGTDGLTFTTPEAEDGSNCVSGEVTVEFTVNTTDYQGQDIVVFETVKEGNTIIAEHKLIGADSQTVTVEENAQPVSVTLTGAKKITGEGAPTDINYENMFQFGIYDKDNNLVTTSGNQGYRKTQQNGTIYAGFALTFDEEGEYTYYIKENKEYKKEDADYTGISLNAADKKVVITVTKGDDNKLVASVKVDEEDKTVTNNTVNVGTFTNTFTKAEPVEVKIDAKKTLTGNNAPTLVNDMFRFYLYDSEDNVVVEAGNTTDADESIRGYRLTAASGKLWNTFNLKYTVDDLEGADSKTFTYTLKEDTEYRKSGVDYTGISFNAASKTITVEVSKNADNKLEAKVNGGDAAVTTVTYDAGEFANTYATTPEIGTTATDAEDNDTTLKPAASVQIEDVIEYKNLVPGTEYTISGTLHKKVVNGDTVTDGGEVTYTSCVVEGTNALTFTPENANGTVTVIFTLDASQLAGEEIVVFESLKQGETEIAAHADIEDDSQTVEVEGAEPVSVEIKAKKAVKSVDENDNELTGEDAYQISAGDFEFEISGPAASGTGIYTKKAKNDAEGVVTLAAGNDLKYTKAGTYEYTVKEVALSDGTITYSTEELKVTVTVTLDTATGKLKADVAYEDNDDTIENTYTKPSVEPAVVVIEADKALSGRTLKADEFEFTLSEGGTVLQTESNARNGKVTFEKIVYTVDQLGEEDNKKFTYTVKEVVPSDDEKEEGMTYDESSKTVEVFVSKVTDGDTTKLVAKVNDAEVTANVNAGRFTNTYEKPKTPEIGTKAEDAKTGEQVAYGEAETTIIDTVTYSDLEPGKTYTMEGTLHKKNVARNGKVTDGGVIAITGTSEDAEVVDGNTVKKTFTASDTGSGTVELTFKFNGEVLRGTSVVAFETAKYEDTTVATHAVITDENQTVDIPDAQTNASDASDGDKYLDGNSNNVTVKDVVTYTNLIPGRTYTVSGVLHDKETGEKLTVPGAKASETFTADKANGTVELTFTIDATALQGKTLVAFEEVTYNNKTVAVHADINDEDQTVYVPEIGTTATDSETKEHIAKADDRVTINDVVEYSGLVPGKQYTMSGQLVKKSDGSVLATAETTFTAGRDGRGTETITFKDVDASELEGESAVAFETCKEGNVEIAVHADINDEDQTVEFPKAETTAEDKADGDKYVAADKVTVVDEVRYENLIPDKEYTVTGTLHDKETGDALTVEGATATTKFKPDAKNGSVKLEFNIDAKDLAGKALVAFESVEYKGIEVAVHADINDEDQTVYVPEIKTTATEGGDHEVAADVEEEVTIVDVVDYKGLIPGKEYTMTGQLHLKSNETKTVGKEVTETFTAEPTGAGSVTLEFTLTADEVKSLKGDSVVAFETAKEDGRGVAVHADINDEAQTVEFPEIKKVKVKVTKAWDGDAADSVKVQLKKNNEDEGDAVILNAENGWTKEWTDLDKEDADGNAYEYTVEELADAGYTQTRFTSNTDTEGNVTVAFTNKKVEKELVKVTVNKKWAKDDIATPITVQLMKNGNAEGEAVELTSDNNWTKTWENLDKAEAGNAIEYTVTETLPTADDGEYYQSGYSKNVDANGNVTIEFTNDKTDEDTPEYVEVKVTKAWENAGETTPVTVQLTKNREPVADKTAILNAENNWTATWTDLILIEDGTVNSYDVTETVPTGFEQVSTERKTVNGNVEVTFTNKKTPEPGKVTAKVTKTWVGEAPASISVQLKKDGENEGNAVELKAPGWSYEWNNLDEGHTYTVEETVPDGYTQTKYTSTTDTKGNVTVAFENTKNPTPEKFQGKIKTQVEVKDGSTTIAVGGADAAASVTTDAAKTVTVVDHISYTGLTKDAVYVVSGTLNEITVVDGEKVANPIANASDKLVADGKTAWTITFENVTIEPGKTYVVFEKAVNKTELEENNNDESKVEDKATHEDADDKSQTVVVEEEIPVITIGTKANLGAKSAITEDGATTGLIHQIIDTVSYEGLDTNKTYKLVGKLMDRATQKEVDVAYYTCTATEVKPDAAKGEAIMIFDLTNAGAKALAGKEIVVYEKLFEVITNEDNTTTEEEVANHEDITDGNQTVKVPEEKTYPVKINKTDLGGTEVEGAVIKVTGADGFEKTWVSKKGETFDLTLKAGDYKFVEIAAPEGYEAVTTTIEFSVGENGKVTVKTTEVDGGGDIEQAADGTIILKDAPETKTPETVEASVTKVWDDANNKDNLRPASLEVTLSTGEKFTLNDANNWTATKTGLPKYNAAGEEITYTWTEAVVNGYTKTEAKVGNVTILTNTHTPTEPQPEAETVDVSVSKVWNDANNKDGLRPENLEVTLSNGTKVILNEANNWTASVNDLPKYDAAKNEITYTWTEPSVTGYTSESATIGKYATVLTNTHTPEEPGDEPETVNVSVKKQWSDENDKDGVRPSEITVKLSTGAEYKLNEGNDWTVTVPNLPKFDADNNEIAYTWTETAVTGYEATQETVNNVTVITNTHTPEEPTPEVEKVDVSVKKAWVDNNNEAGARPDSLTVTLSTGETFELNAANNWTATKKDLPKYDAENNEITYTWTEEEVANYTGASETVGNVTILTNTYEEKENPEVTISKTDAATSEELPGAELIIRNEAGKVVESWTSKEEPHKVQLAPGEYTLTEITAPKGYKVAETIKFTVDENGLVGSDKVVMEDAPLEGTLATRVHVNGKTSASATEAVEIDLGATVGTVIITDTIDYTDLQGGVTYKVTGSLMKIVNGEAEGDPIATQDSYFTADASGNGTWTMVFENPVEVEENTKYVVYESAVPVEGAEEDTIRHENPGDQAQTVVVKPFFEIEEVEVEISKADAVTSEELPGARLIIENASEEVVAEWTSTSTPHKVKLAPGTYTLTEITAPEGYDVAETITFKVTENGVAGGKVIMRDAHTPTPENPENPIVEISKADAVTSAELPGAELIITDTEGLVVAHWVSTEESKKIHLAPGTYTLTELTAPNGYMQAESIVFEVGADGLVSGDKVTMYDDAKSEEFVKDQFDVDVVLNKTWTDADGKTVAWPEGRNATFTLQYFDGKEWKDYINYGQAWTVTLDANNPSYTFYNLPGEINGATAKYRAVETKLEGYDQAISTETDLANKIGEMNAVNKPESTQKPGNPEDGEQKPTPTPGTPDDGKTTPEQDNQKPGDENGNPTSDGDGNQSNTNVTDNTSGKTTVPGRSTSVSSYVPSTTRRVVTPTASGASTVSSSRATATGDNDNSIIWIVAAALAAASIAAAAVIMRRRRHED